MVYTRRLAGLELAVTGWAVLYVVQGQSSVVMRDILVTNDSATAADRVLLQVGPLTKAGAFILARFNVAGGSTVHMDFRQVIEPGEQLLCYTPIAPITIALTGYVFQT